jgi:DNA N-6-adenine-methyltransferase (Dam)
MNDLVKSQKSEITAYDKAKIQYQKITTTQQALLAAQKIGVSIQEILPMATEVLWEQVSLGRFLRKMEKNKGSQGQLSGCTIIGQPEDNTPTVDEIVGSRNRSSFLQKIGSKHDVDIQKYIDLCIENQTLPKDSELLTVIKLGGIMLSVSVEWYTPSKYIESAREVMGSIDLDPASSQLANETVKASKYFTIDDDGLSQEWHGNVWLNPPYGKGSGLFTTKLIEEYQAGRVKSAVLLLNAYGFCEKWFQQIWDYTFCFTDHRIDFYSPQMKAGGPSNGNLFVYIGPNPERFKEVFRQYGHIVIVWE